MIVSSAHIGAEVRFSLLAVLLLQSPEYVINITLPSLLDRTKTGDPVTVYTFIIALFTYKFHFNQVNLTIPSQKTQVSFVITPLSTK